MVWTLLLSGLYITHLFPGAGATQDAKVRGYEVGDREPAPNQDFEIKHSQLCILTLFETYADDFG